MKIKFQADADFNQTILNAIVRSEPLIEFQTADAAGLRGMQDEDVLERAAKSERLLVTHDHRTMPTNFAEFISAQQSPGILIVPQHLALTAVVDDIILIWMVSNAEDWMNRIAYLPL